MKRLISATMAIPAVLLIIFFGGIQLFVVAAITVTALAAHEFYFTVGRGWGGTMKRIATVLTLHVPLIVYAKRGSALEPYMFYFVAPFILYFTFLILRGPLKVKSRKKIVMIPFGMLYIGVLTSYLVRLRLLSNGTNLIFFLLVSVWVSDIFAYYVGRSMGKNKLIPKVSPNKTIEGSLGGIIGTVAIAYFMGQSFPIGLNPQQCALAGLFIAVAGGLGDLAASLIKREEGVKDFGKIMPGHGGALDRVDSLIFAAPVFFYYLIYIVKL